MHKAILVLLICLMGSTKGAVLSDTYSVALFDIPKELNPRRNQTNVYNYILLQLYYPLFQNIAENKLDSVFLDTVRTKSIDAKFKTFQFCLKPGITFSDGNAITVNDLLRNLREVHSLQESLMELGEIRTKGDSVLVVLKEPDPHYFHKLTGVATSLFSERKEFGFPVGRGPFRLVGRTEEKITLERITSNKKSLQSIEFFTPKAALKNPGIVDDWNHSFLTDPKVKLAQQSQFRVRAQTMKSSVLIISHPDINVRHALASCFDRSILKEEIERVLSYKFIDVPGFLPSGVLGWNVQYESTRANGHSLPTSIDLVLRPEELPIFQSYSKRKKLPEQIKVISMENDEQDERVYSRKPYISFIGFDTSGSHSWELGEASIFFETFFRDELLIDKPLVELRDYVVKALRSRSRDEKSQLYAKAHRVLLDSGYVLPLGEIERSFYFPKEIERSSLSWADQVGGFPDISRMRLK